MGWQKIWRVGVSIPLPTACEAVALPFELTPQKQWRKHSRLPLCRLGAPGRAEGGRTSAERPWWRSPYSPLRECGVMVLMHHFSHSDVETTVQSHSKPPQTSFYHAGDVGAPFVPDPASGHTRTLHGGCARGPVLPDPVTRGSRTQHSVTTNTPPK